MKALEKNPKDRHQTAKALADDLSRWLRTGVTGFSGPGPGGKARSPRWRPSWM